MLQKLLTFYLITSGLILHFAAITFALTIGYDKISGHWRFKEVQRVLAGPVDDTPVYKIPRDKLGLATYQTLPVGEWIKIHQQHNQHDVTFERQRHSGSAWNNNDQKLIIFGSDTHGQNWDNSIYTFDIKTLSWEREYKPTSLESYRTDINGYPVSGESDDQQPWAMHTFDGINYLPQKDQLLVASYPKHLTPGRFVNSLKDVWSNIISHPTWSYSFTDKKWIKSRGKAVHFFPYATAYDTNLNKIVGFRPNGVFEYMENKESWKKIAKKSVYAYHTQAIYDSKNSVFLLFGGSHKSNAVHSFKYGDSQSKNMPTPEPRPPATEYTPFAYHYNLGEAIALVDNPTGETSMAQTWAYNYNKDQWRRIKTADLPLRVGMNYHMQYSRNYNMLVLCASAPKEPPSVWVLRL